MFFTVITVFNKSQATVNKLKHTLKCIPGIQSMLKLENTSSIQK